jgi:hypothetical protein
MNQHRLPSISRHDQYTPCCGRPGASWQRIAAPTALPGVTAAKMIAAHMAFVEVIHIPRWHARIEAGGETRINKRNVTKRRHHWIVQSRRPAEMWRRNP